MRHTFFFDLDGTLLPLDMDKFGEVFYDSAKKCGFFDLICEEKGKEIFEKAVYTMMRNDGSVKNEEVFFHTIEELSGVRRERLEPVFVDFYTNEFKQMKQCTRTDERVVEAIQILQDKGYRLVLATNPLFPPIGTNQRIEWAGLRPDDFEYVTYYNNSSYCKPNPKYYMEILDHVGLTANDCYIVGNDVRDDMSAVALGFKGYLVLDHLIGDLENVPTCEQGDYSDLLDFVKSLPQV